MKLSAPPPPPPPPPEPPAPGGQPGEQPNANTPSAGAATPDAAPPEPPAPAPAPKLLQWPAWYSGADAALAAFVLVLAFGAASFVARNSDLWLHLAAGKRLLVGQYTPGSDPFSYSATDHAWVNHSWLTDAVAYLLYGGQGKVLVITKALIVALTFGLLLAIRRPKFPLWPWTVVTCLAVLASSPYLALRPLVVSMLFLAVTLFLLFRMPQKPDSWRFPGAIGITFWLWANSDPWFFIGPLALALIILGDLIQTKLLNSPETLPAPAGTPVAENPANPNPPAGEEEPLGWLPDTVTLAKALGIGVLACMLNPHHFRVWELPFELTGAAGTEVDPRLRQLVYSPTDGDYMSSALLGSNLNGLAYAILFVGGAAMLGFGSGRVRVAHIALWLGFAALSLRSIYAIPFFAIVAVPFVASQLNSLSLRVELKTWGDPKSRMFLIGSSVGRIICVLIVCALCVIAYPGWIHPEANNPAYAPRVAWGVEPEPATVQAAEQFKAWRESGKLPTEARGFVASIDLANYLAWFAPQEKVFINGRLNHHRRELPGYIAVRKGLGLIEVNAEPPKPAEATDVLKKVEAEFVAIHGAPDEPSEAQRRVGRAVLPLYRDTRAWSPWYLDGRTTVFGWHPADAPSGPAFARLRVDPVVLAFGPGGSPVPDPELLLPPPSLGWEEPFVRPPKPGPIGAGQARAWLRYKDAPLERQRRRELTREWVSQQVAPSFFFAVPGTTNLSTHGFATLITLATGNLRFGFKPDTDIEAEMDALALRSVPFLAVHAARRAIAEDPNHPDAYYALALALDDPLLPLSESERAIGRAVALRQCLERLPKPDRYKRGDFSAPASEVAFQLALVYSGRKLGPTDPATGQIARDPKAGQEMVKGFSGMPISVVPLNQLGQALGEDARGNVQRIPAQNAPPNTPLYFLPLDAAFDAVSLASQYVAADTVGDTPDDAKKRVERCETLRKQLETALVRVNERYGQERAGAKDLPRLIQAALNNSRAGEALKLLSESTDLGKDFKDQLGGAAILRISLELALGHVEDANGSIAELMKPDLTAVLEKSGLSGPLLLLRYQKSLQAGEYKAAGELWNTIAGQGIGSVSKFPPLGPTVPRQAILRTVAAVRQKQTQQDAENALAALLIPPLVPLTPLTRALTTEVWKNDWIGLGELFRAQILEQLQGEASYFTKRGTLSLLEGDTRTAKLWFQQARREPPPGWNLHPENTNVAAMYLRLIELAERRAAAP